MRYESVLGESEASQHAATVYVNGGVLSPGLLALVDHAIPRPRPPLSSSKCLVRSRNLRMMERISGNRATFTQRKTLTSKSLSLPEGRAAHVGQASFPKAQAELQEQLAAAAAEKIVTWASLLALRTEEIALL
jgi:hypothetical protein